MAMNFTAICPNIQILSFSIKIGKVDLIKQNCQAQFVIGLTVLFVNFCKTFKKTQCDLQG